jgi:hypothetical protein
MADESGLDSVTSDEWVEIANIVKLLRPVYDVTVELSAEKQPTISKVIPLSTLLLNYYKRESQENPDGSLSKVIHLWDDFCSIIHNFLILSFQTELQQKIVGAGRLCFGVSLTSGRLGMIGYY